MKASSAKYTKVTQKALRFISLCPLWFVVFFVFLLSASGVAQQTEKIYLSGTGNSDMKQWEFMCTGGMNANKWTKIGVPSCWELQSFGKYDYGFAKDSVRGKEKGFYKHSFDVPVSWKGKVINIVFEGVMTDAEVKINGRPAGEIHQGGFYAFKYEITDLLKYGQSNLVEVTVAKHSANQSVNEAERKADFWIFGGIFRPVWLEVLPESHITDSFIDAKANGQFMARVRAFGLATKASVSIQDPNGKTIGTETVTGFAPFNYTNFYWERKFSSAKQWSSEFPNLYKAVFTIYDKNNKSLHTVTQTFGFRTVEVKQRDGIYVNGVKVKMKGVNRHSFRPETGRTLSKQNSIEDVLLMKDMNMNAVRMSHYPPDDHFLDVCDSLGLFVMDELAGWHGHYDTKTGTKLLKEMMVHDVNHPSVIMWANGNEGGHNLELDSLFKQYDIQQRPVVHPWQLFNGIETQHYREYNYGIGNYENGREILMPTEFLHGQFDGGHGAGLEDYWEKMWHDPLSAGGFLWDFADQAVVRKDLHDSLDTDKHRAADGIVGPHHEKEGSYYAIKEIWSPVWLERKEITDQFDGKLNLENRFHFTNLDQCSFEYKLDKFAFGSAKDISGKIKGPSVKPLEKGALHIELPANWKQHDVLYVTAKGVDGKELFTWSFPIKKAANFIPDLQPKTDGLYPGLDLSDEDIQDTTRLRTVAFGNFNLIFNAKTGLLEKIWKGHILLPFGRGPVLCEGSASPDTVVFKKKDDQITITANYSRKSLIQSLVWTIMSTGYVKMEIHYFPAAYFTNMVGVNFSFPEKEIRGVAYLGNGPYRVWKNRMKGNCFGLWALNYNNTETGESWKYPEFKGYRSNMYWCKFVTAGDQSFTVYTENEDLFFRLFTPAWKTDQWHNYEPIFPSGDISFMQGISSIGSKTQRNETTGPMGMKNIFYDYEKDPARALKMVLYFDFNK